MHFLMTSQEPGYKLDLSHFSNFKYSYSNNNLFRITFHKANTPKYGTEVSIIINWLQTDKQVNSSPKKKFPVRCLST